MKVFPAPAQSTELGLFGSAPDCPIAADSKAKKSRAEIKTTLTTAQEPEQHSLALHDGRTMLGRIDQNGKVYTAYSWPTNERLGQFDSLKLATVAICALIGGDR